MIQRRRRRQSAAAHLKVQINVRTPDLLSDYSFCTFVVLRGRAYSIATWFEIRQELERGIRWRDATQTH